MRKICIINQKGGVGKTTTAINLAVGLAKQGKKVLILDLDAQGNVATCLGAESEKDMYDLLIENADVGQCTTRIMENLDVIPSCETLTKAELIMIGEPARESVLAKKLEKLTGYDYVIVDCPPTLRLLNQNAMVFAKEAIIPASTDVLGLDALRKMIYAIQKINEVFDHDMVISKMVPTLFDRRVKHCKQTLSQMESEFYGIVAEPIRLNSKLKEAPTKQQSIFEFSKNSAGSKDYAALVKIVLRDEAKFEGQSRNLATASSKKPKVEI